MAENCFTKSGGWHSSPFAYLSFTGNITCDFISISKCNPNYDGGFSPISLLNGKQKLFNLNSTFNKVREMSSLTSSNSIFFDNKFSIYYKNNAYSYICLFFNGGTNNNVSKSNIIGNHISDTIYLWTGKVLIEDCIISRNSGFNFFINEGHMTVKNCWVHHLGPLSHIRSGGYLITSSLKLLETQTYNIMITFYFSCWENTFFSKNHSFKEEKKKKKNLFFL